MWDLQKAHLHLGFFRNGWFLKTSLFFKHIKVIHCISLILPSRIYQWRRTLSSPLEIIQKERHRIGLWNLFSQSEDLQILNLPFKIGFCLLLGINLLSSQEFLFIFVPHFRPCPPVVKMSRKLRNKPDLLTLPQGWFGLNARKSGRRGRGSTCYTCGTSWILGCCPSSWPPSPRGSWPSWRPAKPNCTWTSTCRTTHYTMSLFRQKWHISPTVSPSIPTHSSPGTFGAWPWALSLAGIAAVGHLEC